MQAKLKTEASRIFNLLGGCLLNTGEMPTEALGASCQSILLHSLTLCAFTAVKPSLKTLGGGENMITAYDYRSNMYVSI